MDLIVRLQEALQQQPGQTGRELARRLKVDKTPVNSTLYNNPSIFEARAGLTAAPKWFLVGSGDADSHLENSSFADRNELADAILDYLTESPLATASVISRAVGVTRSEANSVLFERKDLFQQSTGIGQAPFWAPLGFVAIDFGQQDLASLFPAIDESNAFGETLLDDPQTARVDERDDFDRIFDVTTFDPEVVARFIKEDDGLRATPENPVVDASNPFGLYTWQREAMEAWYSNSFHGIVDAVTGAGKTRLGLAAIGQALGEGRKTLVIVPTVTLLNQWHRDISLLFPVARLGRVGNGHEGRFDTFDILVSTVQSARTRKFSLRDCEGLLIADECHRMGARKNSQALGSQFGWRLGLSATHERMDNAHTTVLLPYFNRVVYTLGYERAMNDGVVAAVKTTFVGVKFSGEEQSQYIDFQRRLSKLRRTLITQMGCRSEPFPAFIEDVLRLCARGSRDEKKAARSWMTYWNLKKDLLARTPAKHKGLATIKDQIQRSNRSLFFTQTIESAEEVALTLEGLGFSVALHHSEITTDERTEILAAFASGDVRCLVTVLTLEEGVDVPDADLAVIVAATKQRRQMIQRMGRVLRRKSDGRDAEFTILFVELTDEDPRLGAHETFVDELIAVAKASSIIIDGRPVRLEDLDLPLGE